MMEVNNSDDLPPGLSFSRDPMNIAMHLNSDEELDEANLMALEEQILSQLGGDITPYQFRMARNGEDDTEPVKISDSRLLEEQIMNEYTS